MTRLSEEELGIIQRIGERDKYQRYELVRGYRRTVELEDMLREWVADIDPGVCCDLPSGGHRESCLVARTEALLVEGDE